MEQILIRHLCPEDFDALTLLQYACFPTVEAAEYYHHHHFASHYQIFPEGSFVVVIRTDVDTQIVGFGSGIFADFDFAHPNHTSTEISGNGMYTTHDPAGTWYYAIDLGVHPDYRRQGIGRRIYEARKALVRRYNKQGIVAGGILADYARHRNELTVADYAANVVAGKLYDSTLSFQLNNGFSYYGLIENYVPNDADNMATLIAWHNPDYRPSTQSRH